MPDAIKKGFGWIRNHKIVSGFLILLVITVVIFSGGTTSGTQTPTSKTLKAQQEQTAKEQAQQEADAKAWDASKAGQLCAKHPDWSHEDCTAIVAGKVHIGMTPDEARAAWGAPDDINRTANKYGTTEQWVYGYSNFLYFEDGKITSISN